MSRSVKAILLVVVMLFSFPYASADEDIHDLLDSYSKVQDIQSVFENGLPIYPEKGWEAEYGFEADTVFPEFDTEEEGQAYCGNPYLLTVTVLAVKGYGIDIQLEDGRKGIVSFDGYDMETKETYSFGTAPGKGTKCNIYCTFSSMGFEMLSKKCLHFTASVTENARKICLQRR